MPSFKSEFSHAVRLKEGRRIRETYPDKIPIICEKSNVEKTIPQIDKKKYLVPIDLTLGQFIYVIRKRLQLKSDQALFVLINGSSPSHSTLMSELYKSNKESDEYLYITYAAESTFGYI